MQRVPREPKEHPCKNCGKVFASVTSLLSHEKMCQVRNPLLGSQTKVQAPKPVSPKRDKQAPLSPNPSHSRPAMAPPQQIQP